MVYFLLSLEGFIGLSYQLLFFRQLTPHVGLSATTSGWIIGIFLGALALGYKHGGAVRDDPLSRFGRNFIICALIASVSLSTLFLGLYFEALAPIIGRMPALIIYCLIGIAPVAYLMGQALPLIIQFKSIGKSASEKGGNALFLSTLGSMAGAIIPMTFIAPMVGVTPILSVMLWITLITGSVLYKTDRTLKWLPAIALGLVAQGVILMPYAMFPDGYTSTAHSDIYLTKTETERLMIANGLTMSATDLNGTNVSNYIDTFQKTLSRLGITNKEIVVLGAGGFMAHRDAPGGNHFVYVDIDPSLKKWAERYFGLESYKVDIIDDDARSYLIGRDSDSVDVIFMDTYSTAYDSPEHLMTADYFALVRDRLKSDGVIIINILMDPLFRDDFSKRFYNTIKTVFPYCQVHQNNGLSSISNVQFTCVKQSLKEGVYRDRGNTISKDIWETRKTL